jgi:hypothetical protein
VGGEVQAADRAAERADRRRPLQVPAGPAGPHHHGRHQVRDESVVVTGTGKETEIDEIRQFRKAIGEFSLILGAGLGQEGPTFGAAAILADGCIVGSWFKVGYQVNGDVDLDFVRSWIGFKAFDDCCRARSFDSNGPAQDAISLS